MRKKAAREKCRDTVRFLREEGKVHLSSCVLSWELQKKRGDVEVAKILRKHAGNLSDRGTGK